MIRGTTVGTYSNNQQHEQHTQEQGLQGGLMLILPSAITVHTIIAHAITFVLDSCYSLVLSLNTITIDTITTNTSTISTIT